MNDNSHKSNYNPHKSLAIIAGEGELPHLILRSRQAGVAGDRTLINDNLNNNLVDNFIIAIKGKTPENMVDGVEHQWFRFGAVGEMLAALHQRGITQLVLAGRISRPSLASLFPDAKARELLKMLGGGLLTGDNKLLSKVVQFLENNGIVVIGAHEICEAMLADAGVMTLQQPQPQHDADADLGAKLLHDIAKYDVGQAVVMANGMVVAIEGMEGTAELLHRSSLLIQHEIMQDVVIQSEIIQAKAIQGKAMQGEIVDAGAILVKMPKFKQELRADMPAIGVETIHSLHKYGFAGAYLAAGKTLMLGKADIIALANQYGLFLCGIDKGNDNE